MNKISRLLVALAVWRGQWRDLYRGIALFVGRLAFAVAKIQKDDGHSTLPDNYWIE
jgi:hypothetical protein